MLLYHRSVLGLCYVCICMFVITFRSVLFVRVLCASPVRVGVCGVCVCVCMSPLALCIICDMYVHGVLAARPASCACAVVSSSIASMSSKST